MARDDRRAFRVDPSRNLGQQFTGAGRIVQRGGVAMVMPNATPEQLAAMENAARAARGEAKARQDRSKASQASGLQRKRYKSFRARGMSHDEAASKSGYTGAAL